MNKKELKKIRHEFDNDPDMLRARIKMLEEKCIAWEDECKSLMFFLVEARATSKYMTSKEFAAVKGDAE